MVRSPIYIDLSEEPTFVSRLIPPPPSTALTLSVLQSIFHPEPATLDLDFIKKCLATPHCIDDCHSLPALDMGQVHPVIKNQTESRPYTLTVPKHLRLARHDKTLPVYYQLDGPVVSRVHAPLPPVSPLTRIVSPPSLSRPVYQAITMSKPPLKKPPSKPWK
jgi:hypothetical protein